MKYKVLEAITNEKLTADEIASLLHITNREVRKAITELRNEGYPICSTSQTRGYWIGSKGEIEHTKAELRKRARELLKTARKLGMKQ